MIFSKAFSPVRNFKKFFKTKANPKNELNLEIIDGLRIVLFFLVISSHLTINGALTLPTTYCKFNSFLSQFNAIIFSRNEKRS